MTTYQQDNWEPIPKPAEITENRLIKAILNGTFAINTTLPSERDLAESLGVTRPTLREALQRLERDGWLEIHQGKPTRVRDYWKEGRLGVLNSLAAHINALPGNFVQDLLSVRLAMAPMYAALSVKHAPKKVSAYLQSKSSLGDSPGKYAHFDWELHHQLTLLSSNPVFVMILNSFEDLYLKLATIYFTLPAARQRSLIYYAELEKAAAVQDMDLAKKCTEEVMQDSIEFWKQADFR